MDDCGDNSDETSKCEGERCDGYSSIRGVGNRVDDANGLARKEKGIKYDSLLLLFVFYSFIFYSV